MWLFTEDGFFSIVQHDKNEELLHVRARLREDLERFLRRAYRNAMEDLGQPDPEIEKAINSIRETPGADYRVRVDLPRFVVAGMIRDAVLDMGYCSFKTRVGSLREDSARAERSHAYLEVWSTMARFQDRVHGFRSLAEMPKEETLERYHEPGPRFQHERFVYPDPIEEEEAEEDFAAFEDQRPSGPETECGWPNYDL